MIISLVDFTLLRSLYNLARLVFMMVGVFILFFRVCHLRVAQEGSITSIFRMAMYQWALRLSILPGLLWKVTHHSISIWRQEFPLLPGRLTQVVISLWINIKSSVRLVSGSPPTSFSRQVTCPMSLWELHRTQAREDFISGAPVLRMLY